MPRLPRLYRLSSAAPAVLCVALSAVTATANTPETPGVFPTLHAEALDKTELLLPGQLQGTYNLLLIYWAPDQTGDVNTWTTVGQALTHTYGDMRMYRMPVNRDENALFRWWDNAAMRTDETDPESLRWTVPLYTDEGTLRQALGIPASDRNVLALLINRAGKVLWLEQGPSTAAGRQSLLQEAMTLHTAVD